MKRLGVKLLFVSLCLVLAVMLAAPACAPEEEKPLKIGLLLPYTGFASPWTAPHCEAAVKLKLDEVGWEVAGRPIELITEDAASDPVVAVEKAKKLVEHDKVEVLIGPLWGASSIAVANYASQAGVCVSGYIQESMVCLRQTPNYQVMPFGTLAGGNVPAGYYAYDVLGYRTATTVYQDFVAGEEFIGGFEAGFEERGGTIVQRQAIPPGTIDFAPYLTNLEEADVLAYWLAGTMNIFLSQYYEFQVKIPIIPVAGWCLESEPLREMGDIPLGIITSGHANEYVTDLPLNAPFVEAMYERGYLPIQYTYAITASTTTFLAAVEATGGDTSPEKLHAAWLKVKVDTPAGVISFDEDGCGIGDLYTYQWTKEGGEYYWKPIKVYEQISFKCSAIDG